ncbi:hypothetical protein BAUCODRAFT_571457 [Baudoinia panamericana UAMH 10762]|uniref:Uncharacterized protein n=1 Tax=Baudoinia panamericana (strain UAMH 10762) TaxID=717646 RepID=M2LAM8_BAUPA|nr:uncharacterized protein BAUCODRAFT_571457 [Baudoinia panamericana UAMH 10762]EMC90872.1 hypothetical protein BAUCODRAFT_571457 [Baudoinia panamericana UAMH 10762]
MSVVQIYLQAHVHHGLLEIVDEDRIRAHSVTISDALGQRDPTKLVKQVTLTGSAAAALKFVLIRVKNKKNKMGLHMKVHDLPLVRVVAIYQAVELLRIRPVQPHIEGHITGHVSHNLVTPEEMIAVHRVFESRRETSKVWRTMVHQLGWYIANDRVSDEDRDALEKAAQALPSLHGEILSKGKELLEKRTVKERLGKVDGGWREKKKSG